MPIERRRITSEDRRRAVASAVRRQFAEGRVIRITEGMRSAICESAEYRAGRMVGRG
jgi:hypothetical protein